MFITQVISLIFFDKNVVADIYEKLDTTSSNEVQSLNSSPVDNLILQDIIDSEIGNIHIPAMLKD